MKAHGALGSSEYGTPAWLISAIRDLMGGIELDPFSSAAHNRTVKAERFFSKEDDAFADGRFWVCRTMLVNPPGGGARLGQRAWRRLTAAYDAGDIRQAVFVAFSVDYLSTTQFPHEGGEFAAGGMLDYPCLIFAKRFGYLTTREDAIEQAAAKDLAGEPRGAELLRQLRAFEADPSLLAVEASSPPRPSCLCWLPPRGADVRIFRHWAARLPVRGKVINA